VLANGLGGDTLLRRFSEEDALVGSGGDELRGVVGGSSEKQGVLLVGATPRSHREALAVIDAEADARGKSEDFRKAITGSGFKIAIPAKDTSDELTFTRVMEFYGTSYQKIIENGGSIVHGDYNQIVGAIKYGRVDYMFGATTKPAEIIAGASDAARAVELVSMPADLMDFLQKNYGYGRGKIEAKTYPKLQAADISTTFMETVFIISADVPDDVAYKITKTLINNRGKLAAINASMADYDPDTAWNNLPVPLHPGAARAYKELGFMK
jgi:hypothetical protein